MTYLHSKLIYTCTILIYKPSIINVNPFNDLFVNKSLKFEYFANYQVIFLFCLAYTQMIHKSKMLLKAIWVFGYPVVQFVDLTIYNLLTQCNAFRGSTMLLKV